MRLPPWHVHPSVWLLLGSAVLGYLLAVRRHQRSGSEPVDRHRRRLFLIGMALLWIGADWPIHDLAERYLYLMHMVQHLLFSLAGAPLVLSGLPPWMLRWLLRPRWLRALVRTVTRPVVALAFFNGVLLFSHWPEIVQVSLQSEWFHLGVHMLIVASSLAMWWPVLSSLPEMPPLPAPGQCLYLFLQSLAPTIPASFLTFGSRPLYPIYATLPRIWGIGVMTDQLVAGLVMKIVGAGILWACIAAIFFRGHAQEERGGLDPSAYRDVEREIRAEVK